MYLSSSTGSGRPPRRALSDGVLPLVSFLRDRDPSEVAMVTKCLLVAGEERIQGRAPFLVSNLDEFPAVKTRQLFHSD